LTPLDDVLPALGRLRAGSSSKGVHVGPTPTRNILTESDYLQRGGLTTCAAASIDPGPNTPGDCALGAIPGESTAAILFTESDIAVIVSHDGQRIRSHRDVVDFLLAHAPGDVVRVSWIDHDGSALSGVLNLATGQPL
jgi:hypothetical protein